MSVLDRLVDDVLAAQPSVAPNRLIVEKELLQHDILREMASAGLLSRLTFIGGTCLRACYGAIRLSENLNFTGGESISYQDLSVLGTITQQMLQEKYDLPAHVTEPMAAESLASTWKIRVTTNPDRKDLPAQHINIDLCSAPSYSSRPMMLRQTYGIEMGTGGLLIRAQSREEILADKFLALALQPRRGKNRDLWDITWLTQQGVELPLDLITKKLSDHHASHEEFRKGLTTRISALGEDAGLRRAFSLEMARLLPAQILRSTIENPDFWPCLVDLVDQYRGRILRHLGRVESGSATTKN